jgi:hypothetical protein
VNGPDTLNGFPLPGQGRAVVAVPPPGPGFGNWAGAPSAALDADGGVVLAYRVRTAHQRGSATVVARLIDGERLTTVATLDKARFGAESLERPALVRTGSGGWRLYVCCATPGSKHWWIDVLEAADLAGLADADARTVFPGDERTGVKDPVIRRYGDRWHAWICRHPLDEPGAEDRMATAYATSWDGLTWEWRGTVLTGRPDTWDARGARLTAVLPNGWASYDGRATREENFSERTGLARPVAEPGRHAFRQEDAQWGSRLEPVAAAPVADVRYLDVLPLPDGGYRLFYESPLPDGSHELRTEVVSG